MMATAMMMILPPPVLGTVAASPVPPVTLASLDLSGLLVGAAAVVASLVALVLIRSAVSGRTGSALSVADRAVSLPLTA
jgi:hypothetical protein